MGYAIESLRDNMGTCSPKADSAYELMDCTHARVLTRSAHFFKH